MFTKNWYRAYAIEIVTTSTKFINYAGQSTSGYANANHLKLGSTSYSSNIPALRNVINNLNTNGGVAFGTGNTPPTLDDYKFSGDLITTITGTATVNVAHDDNGLGATALYSLTNTGSSDITIGEIGLIASLESNTSTGSSYKALLERTVLDTPVTIPAGGIGQVTYTIRMNYPTV